MPNEERSPGVLSQEQIEKIVTITNLTDTEQEQYARILRRFEYAKEQREQRSRFLDGMNFIEDFVTNENTANTYLSPRINEGEVKLNEGTSERKMDTIRNELMAVDVRAEAIAYDDFDRRLSDLGEDMTDIAYRTFNQQRDPFHDDVRAEIVDQLLSQRGVFVQETLSTRTFRRGKKQTVQPQTRVISPLKVFPGNVAMSPFRWNMQPFIVLYDRFDYDTAKQLYGHLPNFAKVKPNGISQRDEFIGEQYTYRFGTLSEGEVEVITYESLPDDEYQIIINGVPMYKPNYKLPWTYPGYDVQYFVNKPVSLDYLYGRPVTAMAKSLQAFANEYLRLLIRKAQQAVDPPYAVPKSGKLYTRNIFNPSAMTVGLKKDDITKLVDHEGVTNADFAMYNLIEQKIEEFIGTPNVAQGLSGNKEMSATEVLTVTKQFVKSLGMLFFALMRVERTLLEMRFFTILDTYLKPVKKIIDPKTKTPFDVYRSFEIDEAKLENNQIGKKVIFLVKENPTNEDIQKAYEFEKQQEMVGNNIRIHYLNISVLEDAVKYFQFSSFIQDKEGTALDKVLFQDQMNQATKIATLELSPVAQSLNVGVIKETFERKWKARDWFQKQVAKPQIPGMNPEEGEVKSKAEKILTDLDQLSANDGTLGAQTIEGLQGAAKGAQRGVDAML